MYAKVAYLTQGTGVALVTHMAGAGALMPWWAPCPHGMLTLTPAAEYLQDSLQV